MMDSEARVVLVNFQDRELGSMEKLRAHREARLHRAFSVFLYYNGRILLQQRARSKYHCGGQWTNTCCSHPAPGEDTVDAARRRLEMETGIRVPRLRELFTFFYCCRLDHGLTEYECDHVLAAEYSGDFHPNPEEVECMKWLSYEELEAEMMEHPHRFTPWFLICVPRVLAWLRGPGYVNCIDL